MAILIKMKSGARHFLAGDAMPELEDFMSKFWTPIDFLGERIMLRISEIESLTPIPDEEVDLMLRELRAQASRLARP